MGTLLILLVTATALTAVAGRVEIWRHKVVQASLGRLGKPLKTSDVVSVTFLGAVLFAALAAVAYGAGTLVANVGWACALVTLIGANLYCLWRIVWDLRDVVKRRRSDPRKAVRKL